MFHQSQLFPNLSESLSTAGKEVTLAAHELDRVERVQDLLQRHERASEGGRQPEHKRAQG